MIGDIKSINFWDFLILFLLAWIIIFQEIFGLGQYSTRVVIPGVLAIYLIRDYSNNSLFKNLNKMKYFIIFIIWSSLVSLAALDLGLAQQTQLKLILSSIVTYLIISYLNSDSDGLKKLLNFYFFPCFIILIYFTINPPSRELGIVGALNANSYGFYGVIASVIATISFLNSKKTILPLAIMIITLVLSYQVVTASASRGGFLMISICFLVMLLAVSIRYKLLSVANFAFLIFFSFIIYQIIYFLYQDLLDSFLFFRFEDTQSSGRFIHMQEAFKVGSNNMLFGVGGGNYAVQPRYFEFGSFSHNAVLESFANYGLLGLISYLLLFVEIFRTSIKNISISLVLIFIIFALVQNYYVVYLLPWFFPFFYISQHIKKLSRT